MRDEISKGPGRSCSSSSRLPLFTRPQVLYSRLTLSPRLRTLIALTHQPSGASPSISSTSLPSGFSPWRYFALRRCCYALACVEVPLTRLLVGGRAHSCRVCRASQPTVRYPATGNGQQRSRYCSIRSVKEPLEAPVTELSDTVEPTMA